MPELRHVISNEHRLLLMLCCSQNYSLLFRVEKALMHGPSERDDLMHTHFDIMLCRTAYTSPADQRATSVRCSQSLHYARRSVACLTSRAGVHYAAHQAVSGNR
jgi:hypothetical protein